MWLLVIYVFQGIGSFYLSYQMLSTFKLLSVASFANISPYCVGCLFISLMISFAVLKNLSLIRSHLFIFAFISFALGDWSKKICLQFMFENVLLCSPLEVLWCHVYPVLFKNHQEHWYSTTHFQKNRWPMSILYLHLNSCSHPSYHIYHSAHMNWDSRFPSVKL